MACRQSFSLVFFASFLVLASCDLNMRQLLKISLKRLASDYQTSLDETDLAGGVCFTAEDGDSSGKCQWPQLTEGQTTLNLTIIAFLALSYDAGVRPICV